MAIVELISYTGHGHPDPLYAAKLLVYTKSTRLKQSSDTMRTIFSLPKEQLDEELNYVANSVRSSWEFVSLTFSIQGVTRAMANQLTRHRVGVSFAQQAMRVVDMSDFEAMLPDAVKAAGKENLWNSCMRTIASTYAMLQEAGVPNQDCRGVLPLNTLTNLIMQVNLRAFAEMLGKRRNLRAQGEFADVMREAERLVLEVMPWTRPFLDPERLRTPTLDALLRRELGNASPIDKPELNAALKELDMVKAVWK